MSKEEVNCWEYNCCGNNGCQESMPPCPVFDKNAGDECWLILGTRCHGEIQDTIEKKRKACKQCKYYSLYDESHKIKVKYKYQLIRTLMKYTKRR